MKVIKLEIMTRSIEAKWTRKQAEKGFNKVNVLGVGVSSTSIPEVLVKIGDFLTKTGKMKLIVTVNPEFVMLAQDDPEFKRILNNADLAVADGVGLRLAGVKDIVPGREVVAQLLKRNYRVFFLGGKAGVAAEMARKYGGAFAAHEDIKSEIRNPKSETNLKIINKINKYNPDILLVAYGAPWQEKWLNANRKLLNAKVGMGVGGTFDYLVGRAAVPPEWVNKAGLEWLWRLVHEPWRWKRQLALVRFVILLVLRG